MTKRASWLKGIVLAGLALAVAPVYANQVTNGGFETGDFTGWTLGGNTGFMGVTCPGAGNVPEGNCQAFAGPVGSNGSISQNVSSPSSSWDLSFIFDPDGGAPSFFQVVFGGVTLLTLNNPADAPPTTFHFTGPTTSAIQTLTFSFRDDPGFLFLDAVSVSVPEPATLALLGMGLAGLGFSRRRKTA